MTPSTLRSTLIALAAVFFLGTAGCSDEAKSARHLSRGDRDMDAGDYDTAEIEYRKAMQRLPDDPVSCGRFGTLLLNEGRILPGYLYLKRSGMLGSTEPQVRLSLGLAALTLARISEARDDAKFALQGLPTDPDALLLLADTSRTAHERDESRQVIATLQAHNPDAPGFHIALGVLRRQEGDQAAAETEFRKALALDPKSAAAEAELGGLALARRNLKEAAAHLKTAADLSPLRSVRRLNYINFLIRTGAVEAAKKELAAITSAAPDYLPAWLATMQLAFIQKRYDDSLAAIAKVLVRDPENYEALMERSSVHMAQEDPDAAIADLELAVTHYSQIPQVHFDLGVAYLKKHEAAKAEESLHHAVILAPTFDGANLLLAELELQKGDPAAVISLLEPIVKTRPRQPVRMYMLLAQAHRAQGNPSAAASIFHALSEAAPDSPAAPYLLGTVYLDLHRPADARKQFEHSLQLNGTYWPALEMLIDLDLLDGKPAAAANRVELSIVKNPKAAPLWVFRATIRQNHHDIDGAETDLQKAIDLDPTFEPAYTQLAQIYFQSNHAQLALDKLTTLAAKTSSVGSLMQVGMLDASLHQYADARIAYEKLLGVDPKFGPALNNLGFLYAENLGQPDKGLELAQRARELSPDDPTVADTLGWILFHKGQFADALPLLQESADKNLADAEVQYHLGIDLYMLGREGPARTAFERSIAGVTDSPVKDDARRRLSILNCDPARASAAMRAVLQSQIRQEPNDPIALVRLAVISQRTGNASEAAANYEALLKITPQVAPIMVTLAQLYAGPLQNPARARELAKAAHEAAPGDAKMSLTLARVHYRLGDYAWSENLLEQASRDLPSTPDLAFDLARGAYSVGKVDDAQTMLQQILAGNPPEATRAPAQQMESLIAVAKNPAEWQAAQPTARGILATDPDSIPAQMVVALGLEQQADYTGAAHIYDKIITADPLFTPATRQSAVLSSEELGDDKKAEPLVIEARKTFLNDPQLSYDLGLINYRRADYAAASRLLQESVNERQSVDAETTYYLGMTHYQLKDSTAAKDELQRALDAHLTGRDADDAKKTIEDINRADPALNLTPGT
jgi:tetratricopeptide (TPR) repeat protein